MDIRTVLLVDDDPNIRKLAKMTLERVGRWQVTVACSGGEALELLKGEMPDVVILDVMMPGLDGKSTLTHIKNDPATAHIPVILMTAKVQHQEMDEYVEMGATGVIVKPFDPLRLPDEIRQLVASSKEGNIP
jgi:CheY-like chemotaxis protein